MGGVQHDWIVADTEDGAVIMPPIPAALDRLSPALETLIRHFPVDRDALAVAASLSQASKPERIPIATVLERLSVSEMRALLARVAEDGGPGVMSDLNRLMFAPVKAPDNQLMSCREFAIKVLKVREVRHKREAEEAVVKREREAELRKQHLDSVMQRAESIWSGLDLLMHQKITSAYDRAAAQLQELRNAYAQAGEIGAFQRRLREFRVQYSNRPAMLRRIEKM